MSPICVLVTGVGPGSTGEQVVKALRAGTRTYLVAAANVDVARTRVVAADERLTLPPAGDPGYLEALAAAADRVGARFLVPGSDPELLRIASGRDRLAALTSAVPLVNGAAAVAICLDKGATAAALARAGVRTPRTVDCESVEGLLRRLLQAGIEYPVILKPRRGGGSADVFVAQDEEELRFHAARMLAGGRSGVAQEYVGDPESEFTTGVLHLPDGRLAGSIALRRELRSLLSTRLRVENRTGRRELGRELAVSSGFSQGEVDDFPEVRAQAERAAAALGSTGPMNVQGRLVRGELWVFEVNPRFSGTEAMRAMAGWNGPEALIAWHLDGRTPLAGYRPPRCTFVRTLAEHRLEGTAQRAASAAARA
jgi:carbamoyl-phosphate synthase large subunit